MDGLLLDTETLWHRSEVELFRRYGDEFTWDDKMAVIGQSFDVAAAHFASRLERPPDEGAALVREMTALMHDEVRRQVEARPGARELVTRLAGLDGVRLGLASNSPRYLVDSALATAGLADAFHAIVTSDDVEHSKPAPDIYLLACERLRVAPSEAVALEDSPSGVAAAKAAGLRVIGVPQFAEADLSAADRVVDSLEQLLTDASEKSRVNS